MTSLNHIRSLLTRVLHLKESPHRTALAFAIGVFIAFSPTYGLHTLSAVFCAWAFRLNAVAVLAGSFINNPWTLVPILGATMWTGVHLLDMSHTPALNWNDLSAMTMYQQISPYAPAFVVGGLALSLLGACISYPIAYWLITTARRAERTSPAPMPDGKETP